MTRTSVLLRATIAAAFLGRCTAFTSRAQPSALAFVDGRISRSSVGAQAQPHHHRHFRGACAMYHELRDTPIRSFASSLLQSSLDQADQTTDVAPSSMYYDSDDEEDTEDVDVDELLDNEADDNDSEEPRSQTHVLYQALIHSVQSSLANLAKKTISLQREMTKAQQLEDTMHRANLIVSNLYKLPPGTTSAQVEDWENDGVVVDLVLDTNQYASFQEESDSLFAIARKMKRGSKVVEELLNASLEGEEILKDALLDLTPISGGDVQLDEGTLILIQERLERSSKKTGFKSPIGDDMTNSNRNNNSMKKLTPQKKSGSSRNKKYQPNPRELISPSGHKVLIGRNRRDNEAICFQLSRPTDIWMHSRGCPGAHVLLCIRRGSPEVTAEDLQFAADLATFYSDARTERKAEVTTAEPKHITKPRGAPPGAVTLRQEGKTLLGRPENVDESLKVAREESGGAWDEMGYRKLGTRAKNKKKTAAVEKETTAKRREEAKEKSKRRQRKEESDWF
jgi:predicted ribosome quality control (RQC) complex YloA/Tae2 family protein